MVWYVLTSDSYHIRRRTLRRRQPQRGRCPAMAIVCVSVLYCFLSSCLRTAHGLSVRNWTNQIKKGYQQRVAADPSFPTKSVTEVLVAAGTQLTAEWNRRGADRLLPELDFMVPAILTAVFGKYYSMWRVAKTLEESPVNGTGNHGTRGSDEGKPGGAGHSQGDPLLFGKLLVPTNAFQPFMLDGVTRPTLVQRMGSFLAPVFPLFRAGIVSSFVGYGIADLIIRIRRLLLPSFVPATQPINVLYASIYTGLFMAVISNVRYQILQGMIEPVVDQVFAKIPVVKNALILLIRWANGFLGSVLAITGMRACGLQKLK